MSEKLMIVKAEIKHWEHAFKTANGHEPTRDDIKANTTIGTVHFVGGISSNDTTKAEKYRLYNKLKKESQEQFTVTKKSRHRTPSPRRPQAVHSASNIAIPSKVPPTVMPASSITKNPFSPHKKKNVPLSVGSARTGWNPFMTPTKSASVFTHTPLPPENLTHPEFKPSQPVKQSNPVISKARKRLRGDSVSPSPPQRDRYIRTNDSKFNLLHQTSLSRDEEKEEDTFFIEESPAKPSANGKSFQPLFNEIPSQPSAFTKHGRKPFKREKSEPGTAHDLFFARSADVLSKRTGKLPDIHAPKKRKMLPAPQGLLPSKDNLFEEPSGNANQPSSSRKRTISNVTQGNTDMPSKLTESNEWNLLPPSPVAEGKSNANSKKKRNKLAEKVQNIDGKDDYDSDAETDMVDIINWHEDSALLEKDGDSGWEVDAELQIQLRPGTLNESAEPEPEPEIFEVDLPEEMQKMLTLSPGNAAGQKEDEILAKGVIQGRLQGGAQVWRPGELGGESEGDDEANHDVDEWEGEGVPWEAGEL